MSVTNAGNAKSKTYQQVIVERVKVDVGNVRSVAIEKRVAKDGTTGSGERVHKDGATATFHARSKKFRVTFNSLMITRSSGDSDISIRGTFLGAFRKNMAVLKVSIRKQS